MPWACRKRRFHPVWRIQEVRYKRSRPWPAWLVHLVGVATDLDLDVLPPTKDLDEVGKMLHEDFGCIGLVDVEPDVPAEHLLAPPPRELPIVADQDRVLVVRVDGQVRVRSLSEFRIRCSPCLVALRTQRRRNRSIHVVVGHEPQRLALHAVSITTRR